MRMAKNDPEWPHTTRTCHRCGRLDVVPRYFWPKCNQAHDRAARRSHRSDHEQTASQSRRGRPDGDRGPLRDRVQGTPRHSQRTACATTATAATSTRARPGRIGQVASDVNPYPKSNHRERRRRGKAEPRRHARQTGTRRTDCDADLTARWPRQKLTQRHDVGIGFLVEPFAADDERLVKVPRCAMGPPKLVNPRRRNAAKTSPTRCGLVLRPMKQLA